ncbi:thiosulfate oxidation carrier protein SoxY [Candidatus Thioglobus autotrophicus]|uniref:thiosulfate oxidation carrier protein SoxY n=1 Tax=Candidatus Thioglobus autotrophicus TaxID=1705394 RepID=UPI00299D468E|nr:thiosulfate oxidation carrier protein SoxY [Candidatus Thioglobus autotrophicus]WPE16619.1 thiosulfate oxidation carrier protein SoxY [Candidatus Thioglobus autotrophicus]
MNRRLFLKQSIAITSVATAVSFGLLTPIKAFANTSEFKELSKKTQRQLSNAQEGEFVLKAPEIAENGAMVPITIDASHMPAVKNISIYVHNNKVPLSAYFEILEASAFITTRIKMAETSVVTAVVGTASGSFIRNKTVKVTLGGCGG